jgi:hypothetical protein
MNQRERNKHGNNSPITFEDFQSKYNQQNGKCFYSGEPMTFDKTSNTTISVDRIDSQKNYTLDNIVFCRKICNTMKNDLPLLEFFQSVSIIKKSLFDSIFFKQDNPGIILNEKYLSGCFTTIMHSMTIRKNPKIIEISKDDLIKCTTNKKGNVP